MTITIIAFVVTMLVMTLSGVLSARHKKHTTEDYLIASQNVKPWLSALSTVATNNSGFMFIGISLIVRRFSGSLGGGRTERSVD